MNWAEKLKKPSATPAASASPITAVSSKPTPSSSTSTAFTQDQIRSVVTPVLILEWLARLYPRTSSKRSPEHGHGASSPSTESKSGGGKDGKVSVSGSVEQKTESPSSASIIDPYLLPFPLFRRGIVNTANNCYMSALFQALLSIPPVYSDAEINRMKLLKLIDATAPSASALRSSLAASPLLTPSPSVLNSSALPSVPLHPLGFAQALYRLSLSASSITSPSLNRSSALITCTPTSFAPLLPGSLLSPSPPSSPSSAPPSSSSLASLPPLQLASPLLYELVTFIRTYGTFPSHWITKSSSPSTSSPSSPREASTASTSVPPKPSLPQTTTTSAPPQRQAQGQGQEQGHGHGQGRGQDHRGQGRVQERGGRGGGRGGGGRGGGRGGHGQTQSTSSVKKPEVLGEPRQNAPPPPSQQQQQLTALHVNIPMTIPVSLPQPDAINIRLPLLQAKFRRAVGSQEDPHELFQSAMDSYHSELSQLERWLDEWVTTKLWGDSLERKDPHSNGSSSSSSNDHQQIQNGTTNPEESKAIPTKQERQGETLSASTSQTASSTPAIYDPKLYDPEALLSLLSESLTTPPSPVSSLSTSSTLSAPDSSLTASPLPSTSLVYLQSLPHEVRESMYTILSIKHRLLASSSEDNSSNIGLFNSSGSSSMNVDVIGEGWGIDSAKAEQWSQVTRGSRRKGGKPTNALNFSKGGGDMGDTGTSLGSRSGISRVKADIRIANESMVSSLFGGKIKIITSQGKKLSTHYQPFLALTLPLRAASGVYSGAGSAVPCIYSALNVLYQPDTIEPSPSNPIRRSQMTRIDSLPPVLVLHLNRFVVDLSPYSMGYSNGGGMTTNSSGSGLVDQNGLTKIQSHVLFPYLFKASQKQLEGTSMFPPLRPGQAAEGANITKTTSNSNNNNNNNNKNSNNNTKLSAPEPGVDHVYELCAVITHRGQFVASGHYTTYVKVNKSVVKTTAIANTTNTTSATTNVAGASAIATAANAASETNNTATASAPTTSSSNDISNTSLTIEQGEDVWVEADDTNVRVVSLEAVLSAQAYVLIYSNVKNTRGFT